MRDDRIEIRGLLARAIIGLHEWERRSRQDVRISMTLFTDLRKAGASDDVRDSVDYGQVTRRVFEFVKSINVPLIIADNFTGAIDELRIGDTYRSVVVPEPGTLAALGTGVAALAAWRRRHPRASR